MFLIKCDNEFKPVQLILTHFELLKVNPLRDNLNNLEEVYYEPLKAILF